MANDLHEIRTVILTDSSGHAFTYSYRVQTIVDALVWLEKTETNYQRRVIREELRKEGRCTTNTPAGT